MTYSPPPWIDQFDGADADLAASPYSYGAGEPPAGWTAFGSSSPWNTAVPASPTLASNSAAIVTWLGSPTDRYIGYGPTNLDEDYDFPVYYAAADDPIVRIKCMAGGADPSYLGYNRRGIITNAHNRLMPLPAEATPAGGDDAHMVIQTATKMFELWQTNVWTPGEGRIGCKWAAVSTINSNTGVPEPDVNGNTFGATASGISAGAGSIRLVDLQAGRIPHALFMVTRYVRKVSNITPATGASLGDPTVTAGDANDLTRPLTGARFWWSLSDAATNALSIPDWKKTILRCLHEFGGIIGDTGGSSGWSPHFESAAVDVAHGQTDRWRTYAAAQGWALSGGGSSPYVIPLATGVDWSNLRIVVMP